MQKQNLTGRYLIIIFFNIICSYSLNVEATNKAADLIANLISIITPYQDDKAKIFKNCLEKISCELGYFDPHIRDGLVKEQLANLIYQYIPDGGPPLTGWKKAVINHFEPQKKDTNSTE